jgi:hypothetical protein
MGAGGGLAGNAGTGIAGKGGAGNAGRGVASKFGGSREGVAADGIKAEALRCKGSLGSQSKGIEENANAWGQGLPPRPSLGPEVYARFP